MSGTGTGTGTGTDSGAFFGRRILGDGDAFAFDGELDAPAEFAGHLVEVGSVPQVFAAPAHPYTAGLLGAIPRIDRAVTMTSVPGDLPSLLDPPAGCRFGMALVHVAVRHDLPKPRRQSAVPPAHVASDPRAPSPPTALRFRAISTGP